MTILDKVQKFNIYKKIIILIFLIFLELILYIYTDNRSIEKKNRINKIKKMIYIIVKVLLSFSLIIFPFILKLSNKNSTNLFYGFCIFIPIIIIKYFYYVLNSF